MKTNTIALNYKGFRFPPEIISHAVWLYFRFSLSFRDVEELLAQRGIVVTYETVRQWCLKFGQTYANELRRRRPRCGDKWHLDARVSEDQRENALSLESGGSAWQRA
jgi:putative transposase